jgi:hypothetical protein
MPFFFILQDTFVLCKVTQRTDWTSENNAVGNNNHHPQQSNVAATSAVSVEQQDAAASSVVGAERPSDVATLDTAAQITTPDGDDGIKEWLEELIDTSFDPPLTTVVDSVSAGPSLDEQIAESSVCYYHSVLPLTCSD